MTLTTTDPARPSRRDRTLDRLWLAAFAALVYLPMLAMHPGQVEADTKSYLYLDPTRFISRAASLWDAKIGLGTLSHQTIGYLFPMGPWFWFTEDVLGMPAWIAQRIWLGTIIFAAALGMRALASQFGLSRSGAFIAALAYSFSPYVLGYSGVYSLLLGPWAALPWWIIWTRRGVRDGGWYYPAIIALSIQFVGSLNASSLLFCLIGPALWLPYAVIGIREARWRDGWSFAWRTGALTGIASLWWIVPLVIEGRYGVNILRFTETVETTSATSAPFEVLRGLGYWFFYGGDSNGPWVDARTWFTQRVPFVFVTFLLPAISLGAASIVRWRARTYSAILVIVGTIVAVGSAPYDRPSMYGRAFKSLTLGTSFGSAFRNFNRATPLVVCGLAALLGAGVDVIGNHLRGRSRPKLAACSTAIVAVLCVGAAAPALSGGYYSRYLERNGTIPSYWKDAIAALAAGDPHTRVLALPGSDFASYRWGDTRDPIEPGLMDRPYVAREIVPWGSEQSVAFLQAVDRRVQDGSIDPNGLAPVLRLMGVGDVVLRLDLRTDQWNLIPSGALWRTFTDRGAAGLGTPTRFGAKIPGALRYPEIGDVTKPNILQPNPPPVAILKVQDPSPIIRTKPSADPIVVAGDGEGIVDLAAASLLDPQRVILFASSVGESSPLRQQLPKNSLLVLTDTNRRRGQRWGVLHDQFGYTETAGERPMAKDPTDQRLAVFPDDTDAERTVAILNGVRSLRASSYGTPAFGFVPGERPAAAFDGDVRTGWRVNAGVPVSREHIEVTLDEPTTTDHINIVQVSPSAALSKSKKYRLITRVRITFDGKRTIVRGLGRDSRRKTGQALRFPQQTFSKVDIAIDGSSGTSITAGGLRNAVGFSEIRIPRPSGRGFVRVSEAIRTPVSMLRNLGARSLEFPLVISLTRESTMDSAAFTRRFSLPTTRSFTFAATALLSAYARDADIDRAIGLPDASAGAYTASSSSRYISVATRAGAATDGDLGTAWVNVLGNPRAELKLRFANSRTVDRMDLQVATDGRHSVPRVISIRADRGPKRTLTLPVLATTSPTGLTKFPISFAPVTGRSIKIRVLKSVPVMRAGIVLPAAIAELGIPDTQRPTSPTLEGTCTNDLVKVDGKPLPVRITGTTSDALEEAKLQVTPCVADLTLAAGQHEIQVTESPRNPTGFDISRIVLASSSGGGPAPAAQVAAAPPTPVPDPASGAAPNSAHVTSTVPSTTSAPKVRITHEARSTSELKVTGATKPFWLVLGQSYNEGWKATADGRDLGRPTLADGFANAWHITPRGTGPIEIHLAWAPQQRVNFALWTSLVGGLTCVGVIAFGYSRRRRSASQRDLGPLPRSVDAGPALHGLASVAIALAVATACSLVVDPVFGLIAGVFTWIATHRRSFRIAIRFAPAAMLVLIAVGVPIQQRVNRYPAFFNWVQQFGWARWVAWIAVVALAIDTVLLRPRDERSG